MAKTTELTTTGNGQEEKYLTKGNVSGLAEILASALGTETLGVNDLTRLKVPSGTGAAVWNLPTPRGDEAVKELHGVIVGHHLYRVFWQDSIETGGNRPPNCHSAKSDFGSLSRAEIIEIFDNMTEVGALSTAVRAPQRPNGNLAANPQPCASCVFSQFGSAKNERGQLCNQKRAVYILLEGNLLPVVINVPAKSLNASKQYFLGLVNSGFIASAVETVFTLVKSQNQNGVSYFQIGFAQGRALTEAEAQRTAAYAESLKPFIGINSLAEYADEEIN